MQHVPVLLYEILKLFETCHLDVFVDGTLGAGGHAAAILEAHPEITRYIGIDRDPEALEIATERLARWSDKMIYHRGTFATFSDIIGPSKIDGMLLDLGVSSMQLDRPKRGFSFAQEGPLDMRMSPDTSLTAEEVVNTWSEGELGRVFREYGEEKRWRAAARTIVEERKGTPIKTTKQLATVLQKALGTYRKGKINPLTLAFQALRICVNQEIEILEQTLPLAIDHLAKGGRLAVISFHSLEDRPVKEAFRYAASDKHLTSGLAGLFLDKEQTVKIITKKPICPSEKEILSNPRSRSAKLRVVEKQ